MTPEALSAYLLSKGIPEDIAQSVIICYLVAGGPETIRYPKAWAWRKAQWLKIDEARRPGGMTFAAKRRPQATELPTALRSKEPTPYRVAAARQELDRYFKPRVISTLKRWKVGYYPDYLVIRRER